MHSLKAEEQGRVLVHASQGTWLFAPVGRVSDDSPPCYNPATNVPLRNNVRSTWKDTALPHRNNTSGDGQSDQCQQVSGTAKSHQLPICCRIWMNTMHAGKTQADITASVFSINQCYCFGAASRLVVFHNPWHCTTFKLILKITNVVSV